MKIDGVVKTKDGAERLVGFPLSPEEYEKYRDAELVDVPRRFESTDVEAILFIAKHRIPGVATGSVEEFQRFLLEWRRLRDEEDWGDDEELLAASLINKLDDWENAFGAMASAYMTEVCEDEYAELGLYYFNKWAEERTDGNFEFLIQDFVDFDALGRFCEENENGYWCEIAERWVDMENQEKEK